MVPQFNISTYLSSHPLSPGMSVHCPLVADIDLFPGSPEQSVYLVGQ